jgi:hypothetical protein
MDTYRITIDGDKNTHVYDYEDENEPNVAWEAIKDVLTVLGYHRYAAPMYDENVRALMYANDAGDKVIVSQEWIESCMSC